MTDLSGRKLAQIILDKVESDDAYTNIALAEVMRNHPRLDQREKAFGTELVYGTMRHLLKIDHILGRLLSRPLKSLALSVKNLLRLSLYQLMYLPDIPVHAVIHSAVEETKRSKYSGLAPMVNGVLRNFLRKQAEISFPDPQSDYPSYLALEYSTPAWLVNRWLAQFGRDRTEHILRASNERPPFSVRVNRLLATVSEVVTGMEEQGFTVKPGAILPEALILKDTPLPIEEVPIFRDGKLFIQDESSMLVAHLLDPHQGETIVDLCAAPGGKSTHIAELMDNQGTIYSIDDHPHKVELIGENAHRMHLDCIRPCLGDARQFQLPDHVEAHRVLVDAPCSGTGVLRRRVDAKYRKKPEDINGLAEVQRQILSQAAKMVKPGGCLVYSTCTLECEEDEAQIEWFLNNYPYYRVDHYRDFLPEELTSHLFDPNQPWAKVLPETCGGDGFFLCRFTRFE